MFDKKFNHEDESSPDPGALVICEDDAELRELLVSGLGYCGFRACGVASAEDLDRHLADQPADVVILDIGLPGEDGFSAAARLRRARPDLGIVMLTARALVDDRIHGRNQGADLYFVKPVDLRELAAALGNLRRRLARSGAGADGAWRLHRGLAALESPDGRSIPLTQSELVLLEQLLEAPGSPLDRSALHRALGWPRDAQSDHRLENLVSRLRKKAAAAAPEQPLPVRTRHGLGYAFLAPGRLEP